MGTLAGMTANPARFDRLATWMATASGAAELQIVGMYKLAGGAIQQNWHIEILANGGVLPAPVRLSCARMRRHQLANRAAAPKNLRFCLLLMLPA